jgi:hypothetical protein
LPLPEPATERVANQAERERIDASGLLANFIPGAAGMRCATASALGSAVIAALQVDDVTAAIATSRALLAFVEFLAADRLNAVTPVVLSGGSPHQTNEPIMWPR